MDQTTVVTGLDEVRQKMRELPGKVDRHIARHAVSTGAAIIRDEMKELAPVWSGSAETGHAEPGALKKAVFMKYDSEQSGDGRIAYVVGVRHGKSRESVGKGKHNLDVWWFFIVEFGRRNGKGRHSFMRPAFDAKKEAAANAMMDDLRSGIAEALA